MQQSIILLTVTALSTAALAETSAPPQTTASPLLGRWNWKPLAGNCPEVHEYFADGILQVNSGEEVLEKQYSATAVPGQTGLYRIEMTSVRSNGKPDCQGSLSQIGNTAVVFLQFDNADGIYTCASEDGMSCYGSAIRATK